MFKLSKKFSVLLVVVMLCSNSICTTASEIPVITEDNYYNLLKQVPYNDVTFLGTHNAGANISPNSLADFEFSESNANQYLSLIEQLDAGVRMLDIDLEKGVIGFKKRLAIVHGTYILGWTDATKAFTELRKWIEAHPDQIVTINFSNKMGFDGSFNEDIKNLFIETDFDQYVYSYNQNRQTNDPWPTLNEMINMGKTVMIMGLDQASWYHDNQNFFYDDERVIKNGWKAKMHKDLAPTQLLTDAKLSEENRLFVYNGQVSRRKFPDDTPYLTAANPIQSREANTYEHTYNIAEEIEIRIRDDNQVVNFIIVDYFQEGEGVKETVKQLNMERLAQLGYGTLEQEIEPYNLAINCHAYSNSEEARKSNYIHQGNDGSLQTRYCANDGDNGKYYWEVDLGRVCDLTDIEILWEMDNKEYKFQIQVSNDRENWTTIVDKSQGNEIYTQFQSYDVDTQARFVRIKDINHGSGSFSFYDFKVLGYRELLNKKIRTNLSVLTYANASNEEGDKGNYISHGNDGDRNTRFCAADSNNGYEYYVDLGKRYELTDFEVIWEFDQRKYDYEILISDDKEQWTKIVDKNNNDSMEQIQQGNFNAGTKARYVKIKSTGLEDNTAFSFYEFKVFGY